MYLPNKYTAWYNQIITAAQNRIILDSRYTEKHHIIPRSLGGDNTASNLVTLTGREHYLCHRLLTKMLLNIPKQKMSYAFWLMSTHHKDTGKIKITSRSYDTARRLFSENLAQRDNTEFSKASLGLKRSDATKAKLKQKMTDLWAKRKADGWVYTHTENTKKMVATMSENWHTIHSEDSISSMRKNKIGKIKTILPDGSYVMTAKPDQIQ